MGRIEVRRMDGATWVRLEDGLVVIPIRLAERREWFGEWRELLGDAVRDGRAVIGFGWKEAAE